MSSSSNIIFKVQELTISQDLPDDQNTYCIKFSQNSDSKGNTEQQKFTEKSINFNQEITFQADLQQNLTVQLFSNDQSEDKEIQAQNIELKDSKNEESIEQSLEFKKADSDISFTLKASYIVKQEKCEGEDQQQNTETKQEEDVKIEDQQKKDEEVEQKDSHCQEQENEQEDKKQSQQTISPQKNKPNQENQKREERKREELIKINNDVQQHKFVIEGIRGYLDREIDNQGGNQYDTFTTLRVGENTFKTKIHQNAANRPEWSDNFTFYSCSDNRIDIEVNDKIEENKQKLVGKGFIPIDSLYKNYSGHHKGQKAEVVLQKGDKKDIIGHIYLDIHSLPPNTNLIINPEKGRGKKTIIKKKNPNNQSVMSKNTKTNESQEYDQLDQSKIQTTNNQSIRYNDTLLNKSQSVSSIFGYGLSSFQSASSLQHSVPTISFTKARRFNKDNQLQTKSLVNTTRNKDQDLTLPSLFTNQNQFTKKGPSMGYGNKVIAPVYQQVNAKVNPGPSHYFTNDEQKFSKVVGVKSCTFGVSRDTFSKVYMPESKIQNLNFIKELPGPSQYQQNVHDKKKTNRGVTMQFRIEPVKDDSYLTPGPQAYDQSTFLDESKAKGVGFGYSKRKPFQPAYSPGPAQYKIPSKFEKYEKKQALKKKKMTTLGY